VQRPGSGVKGDEVFLKLVLFCMLYYNDVYSERKQDMSLMSELSNG